MSRKSKIDREGSLKLLGVKARTNLNMRDCQFKISEELRQILAVHTFIFIHRAVVIVVNLKPLTAQ